MKPFLLALALMGCSCSAPASGTTKHSVEVAGFTRSYCMHVPDKIDAKKALPLVFVFHGSGGDGAGMEEFTEFTPVAEREGFIVVYPDAVSQNWNDGREAESIPSQARHVDDVAFVSSMIRDIGGRHRIDPKRVFAAGFSNGGIFVHYLAAHLSPEIAAIADVSGGIAEPFAPAFKPEAPVSIFMVHGTADPFVPFEGGNVDYRGYGRITSTQHTIEAWNKVNGSRANPATGALPDTNETDQCHVTWSRWGGGKNGAELVLYTIEGGGHAWPGGPQFLPVSIIGHVCRDFDAAPAIWEFFKNHPKA